MTLTAKELSALAAYHFVHANLRRLPDQFGKQPGDRFTLDRNGWGLLELRYDNDPVAVFNHGWDDLAFEFCYDLCAMEKETRTRRNNKRGEADE